MADKKKIDAVTSTARGGSTKRPAVIGFGTATAKNKRATNAHNVTLMERPKNAGICTSHNVTKTDFNNTIAPTNRYDDDYRLIAYGKFLRTITLDSILDEKIEKQREDIDKDMAQLAQCLEKNITMVAAASKMLKDISFTCKQKRLLDMKKQDCNQFYEVAEKENHQEILENTTKKLDPFFNELKTKNVDFGYSKETGHKQLLDAVNEVLKCFNKLKQYFNLHSRKLDEYHKVQNICDELEKSYTELADMKKELDSKFPHFSERLMVESSPKLSAFVDVDTDDEE